MGFKDQLKKDLNTFLNKNEFAELHTINGVELSIVIDNDQLKERSKKEYDGLTVGETLLFVSKSDYGPKPEQWTPIVFDNRQMYVFDAREDVGMLEIILTQNRGG
ncbi:hypothetical protein [Desulfitobacterium hafniense]|uniref:Uncharacterized protein n=1 Tax=Desulfitobacterium hafniense (strain Y51) TaxID=138119 RepID=Q24VH3_DESHY|nr:hypothetical protein [Desulfitobacterium hafniense]BAE83969.1 hypothetical protein DSY2180 [Desulfitobacterium hafniense Y51]